MDASERRAAVFYAILEFQDEMGYSHVDPYLILSQSSLETAGFTSRRIREDNNAFGMKYPSQRETLAIGESGPEPGEPGGFCIFQDLRDSVKDYFMRQQVFDIPNTDDATDYIRATVDSGYASGASYANAWADIYANDSVAWEIMLDDFDVVADRPTSSDNASLALFGLAAVAVLASRR